jgi:hypothetical protein
VTGDCHAGICGSLGAKFPQATRPLVYMSAKDGWLGRRRQRSYSSESTVR